MEIRKSNLIVGLAGGTAGRGAKTYKLALPSTWIRKMGIGEDAREVELCFDDGQIIIRKAMSLGEFAARQKTLGHDVRMFRYHDGDSLCTSICADFTSRTLRAENHTDNLVKTAFGKKAYPSWDNFMAFLEERCVPRSRAGLREYLASVGLDAYEPLEIIKKTSGRMAEDDQWLEMEAPGCPSDL
jgi:hypothetical protein